MEGESLKIHHKGLDPNADFSSHTGFKGESLEIRHTALEPNADSKSHTGFNLCQLICIVFRFRLSTFLREMNMI